MYVTKSYLETNQGTFKKGEEVSAYIAQRYWRYVKEVDARGNDIIKNVKVPNPTVNEITEEIIVTVESLSNFKTKKQLEVYGRTLNVELDRRETMKNMYADLLKKAK